MPAGSSASPSISPVPPRQKLDHPSSIADPGGAELTSPDKDVRTSRVSLRLPGRGHHRALLPAVDDPVWDRFSKRRREYRVHQHTRWPFAAWDAPCGSLLPQVRRAMHRKPLH